MLLPGQNTLPLDPSLNTGHPNAVRFCNTDQVSMEC